MNKQTVTYKLSGMICVSCEDEVNTALLHTRGVMTSDAVYRKASVTITYDADLIPETAFPLLLAETGYPVGGSGRTGLISDAVSIFLTIVLYFLIPALTGLVSVPSAQSAANLTAVFLIGLLTGVHCIGMCGGIMLAQKNAVVYNLGRLVSYTLMGVVFGLLGKALVYDLQTKSMLQTLCGLLVVLIGLNQWGIPALRQVSLQLRRPCRTPGGTPLIVGLLNGLLPCGALSGMWLLAAGSGSALKGGLEMACFGAGTLPAMLLFGCAGKFLPKRFNRCLVRGSTVIILALGLHMITQGLSLVL